MARAYGRRVFGGGQSLPCVTAKGSELHIYHVAGVKDEVRAMSLHMSSGIQRCGELDRHWAHKSFRVENRTHIKTGVLRGLIWRTRSPQ